MKITGRYPTQWFIPLLAILSACQSIGSTGDIATAEYVDLERFAGDWYVIANIPTWLEKDAYDAVERYAPPNNGRVETTFTMRKGGFDAPIKTYRPTGFVRDDGSNAIWGMQFIWPFKADYRILYVDPEYQETIIGRNKRDYVWVMTRDPKISEDNYRRLVERVAAAGYATDQLRRIPHAAAQSSIAAASD